MQNTTTQHMQHLSKHKCTYVINKTNILKQTQTKTKQLHSKTTDNTTTQHIKRETAHIQNITITKHEHK